MLRPATSQPGLTTLVVLTGASVLTLNMYLPSLAALADDFGVTYAQASLSLSLFMVLMAVLQIVIGPISDRMGRRPVIFWTTVIFVIASIGCAMAQNFTTFLAFRMVQAAVVAAGALPRAIVRDTSPPQEAMARLGTIGIAMALAPMLSPMLGGVLGDLFGWRSNFWFFSSLGLFMLWLIWVDLGETNRAPEASLGAQFRKYPRVALDRGFWSYSLCLGFSLGVFFSYVTGVPLVAGETFGMSPTMIGAAMGLPPIGFMLGNTITARVGRRVSLSSMMITGRAVTLVGLVGAGACLMLEIDHPAAFFTWMIAIGVGNGLTLPAANAGAMSTHPDMAGTAAGLSGAFGLFMGAVATALTGALLQISPTPLVLLVILAAYGLAGLAAALPARKIEGQLSQGT
ncbi:MAG: multidrug effflux MFS transporter [Rhodobacteraceae bacterium]|nr:multidrug effflux MFS transporter [Paracoccaceae bacterium]